MSTLAICILSAVFIRDIPISMLPDVPIPRIIIQLSAPSTDARTLENTVIRPIRNQLLQVTNLEDVHSETGNGFATLELDLAYGTNIDLAFIEINEKIDQLLYLLPRDLSRPRIIKTTVSDLPVYRLAVVAKDSALVSPLELANFCENVISRRLEQLDEIAFVDMHGFKEPQILIKPKLKLLQAIDLDTDQLASSIQNANIQLGNVVLKDGAYEYNVELSSRLIKPDDINQIIIETPKQNFRLFELADVEYTSRRSRGSFLLQNEQAIGLTIRKQADANNFTLKATMDNLLLAFEEDYPLVEVSIIDDQTSILKASFDSLSSSLIYGLLFSVFIMFLFFKDWRLATLIACVVPVSLLVSLFAFYLLDITINIISLSGLILGVGLMIDNAIIMIENIRQFQANKNDDSAIVMGANEVIKPLISSALTTCSVFLPLILLSGLAGALFYDQALSISIALISSLLVSYVVIPVVIANLIHFKQRTESHKHGFHHAVINLTVKWKWVVVFIFLLGIGITSLLFTKLPLSSFPAMTIRSLTIDIDWNEQISIEENEARLRRIINHFDEDFDQMSVELGELQYQLTTRNQQINEAKILGHFTDQDYENLKSKMIKYQQRFYPFSIFDIRPAENIVDQVFAQNESPLIANISQQNSLEAPDIHVMNKVVDALKNELLVDLPPTSTNLEFKIDEQKLAVYKVSRSELISTLKILFNELYTTDLSSSERFIPIYIGNDDQSDIQQRLRKTMVQNRSGQYLPLQTFINTEKIDAYKIIHADRAGEIVPLHVEKYSQNTMEKMRSAVQEFGQLSVRFTGQYFIDQKLVSDLSYIFLIVIAMLYLILAAQFESFIQPVIVLLDVPVSLSASLWTLFLFHQSINLVSIVGMIITAGIVINDSILKVDLINKHRLTGATITQAIHYASRRRFRPIIMTSLTTILALVPLFFSSGLGVELQIPMVYAVIGGLIVGTIASLIFIPALYAVMYTKNSPTKTNHR